MSLWLCLAPFQDPAPGPAPQRVELKLTSGWSLVGRLVEEGAQQIELHVEGLGSVTFPRSQIAWLRAMPASAAASRPAAAAPEGGDWTPRDEWFVLHGPDGKGLGTLHLMQSVGGDDRGTPGLRIEAEWRITGGDHPQQISQVEESDPTGRALRLFYREVTVDPGRPHAVHERIVTATLQDGRLAVTESTGQGRVPRVLPLTGEVTFPLLWEERARRGVEAATAEVFDPREGSCVARSVEYPGPRQVLIKGEPEAVTRVRHSRGSEGDEEWLDARGRIVRRELHGVWFVARAATAAEAKISGDRGISVAAVQARAEPQGRFRMLLPHPGWRFQADASQAVVRAHEPVLGLTATASVLDQLLPGATASAALDAAVRAARLALGLQATSPLRPLSDLPAGALGVELRHRGPDPRRPAVEVELWTRVCVLPGAQVWTAWCESGPLACQAESEPDFLRMRRLFEPERTAAVDASLRGR